MADEDPADPADADRPRGFLTERDRKYLTGESGIEPFSDHERKVRSDIRERAWNALLDLVLVVDHLQQRDLDRVLGSPRHGEPGESDRERAVTRDVVYRRMVELLYRYPGTGDEKPLEAIERYVERAYAATEYDPSPWDAGTVRLGDPEATIDVDAPREIDLQTLDEKLERVREGRVGWDTLDDDELLVASMWADERGLPGSSSGEAFVSAFRERLVEQITEAWEGAGPGEG